MKIGRLSSHARPDSDINYTERSPLVVPPSRDLPPPVADAGGAGTPNWPKRSEAKTLKHAKSRPRSFQRPPCRTPNPPFEKKPWYNPMGWFDKEEYATFAGEPVRAGI